MSLLKIVSLGKILFILLLLFLLQNLSLFADKIEYKYYFNKPQITKQGDYYRVEMNGFMSISKPGTPELPSKSVQLLLPPGEQAISISVIYEGINDLPGEYRIYPRQRPYPIGYQGEVEFTEPDPEIYNSNMPFPEKLNSEIQTQYLGGHSIALLNIFPVQYIPASGKVSYFSEMRVLIETESTVEAENSFNNFYRNDKKTNERVRNIIDNPEQIGLYPSQSNTRSGDNKYIIITSNTYSSSFDSFADFKTKQGYNVLIKTTNDIYSEYSGVDNQDKIRNFIKYVYQNLGTEYVLLGGDVEIVPHRGFYGWVNTWPNPTEDYDIPADLYYAALDRVGSGAGPDWNVDNDNKWGENSEADYFAEVFIGRISADSGTEFSSALNKQMMYQQNPVASDLEKAIMVGEQLDPLTWGGTYKDEVMNGGNYNGYTTTGFPGNFTVQTQYERDGSWSWTDLKNKMNAGTNILNHLGHSTPDNNMNFYRSNVTNSNLTSNGTNHNFYIIYTQGCYPASFDNRWSDGSYDNEDCIGEKFTTISNGCVAFIGNSRYGWYTAGGTNGSSQYLDRQFFDALFGENIYKLGEINNDSKEDGASLCNTWDALRWSYYALNLLSDPSLDVWTDTPETFSPSYCNSIDITDTQLNVSVGISGVLVGLSQNGDHIGSGITDGTGNVTITFDNSPYDGFMDIYISAHNYNIHSGTIIVYGRYTISGYVIDNESLPLNDVLITLSGYENDTEYTNEDGYYNFYDLLGGKYYMITPSMDDWTFNPDHMEFDPLESDQYNQDFIGTSDLFHIAGYINYCISGFPINSVILYIFGNTIDSIITNTNGYYNSTDLMRSENYLFVPNKENDISVNCISAMDAAWVLKYSIGLMDFTECQIAAGDVTGYYGVTAQDAAQILKYSVGLIDEFPVGKDWRFIPQNRYYQDLQQNFFNENYIGVVYGDVTHNWTPSVLIMKDGDTEQNRILSLNSATGSPGEVVNIPVNLQNIEDVISARIILTYDATLVTFQEVNLTSLTEGFLIDYNNLSGEVRIAFAGLYPIEEGGDILELSFEINEYVRKDTCALLHLNKVYINEIEIANTIDANIIISTTENLLSSYDYSIGNNINFFPNPFKNNINIEFFLNESTDIEIKLYNVHGQEVKTIINDRIPKGKNIMTCQRLDLQNGIYLIRIKSNNQVVIKKILHLK